MKSIKEKLSSTKPRDLKKMTKAFADGGCSCYQDSFMEEANRASAIDFPTVKCMVTDTYFCCYNMFDIGVFSTMTVIPLEQIVNLYRTNINQDNKYDYDNFHLAIELSNGKRRLTASVARDKKNILEIYNEVINCVRCRMTVRNPEV